MNLKMMIWWLINVFAILVSADVNELVQRVWDLEHNYVALNDRFDSLESNYTLLKTKLKSLNNLEDMLVTRYGLVRRCELPTAVNGEVLCNFDDIIPTTVCRIICHPGYIVSPGKETTVCLPGNKWSKNLQCELPLVVVSGGSVNSEQDGDSSVEVLSFHNSTGCTIQIPNMPVHEGDMRMFHNLLYVPSGPKLLVCNGLRGSPVTTCDSWKIGDTAWKNHSRPHSPESPFERLKYIGFGSKKGGLKDKGRYAAVSATLYKNIIMTGGMGSSADGVHTPISSSRKLKEYKTKSYWEPLINDQKKKRAFLCGVALQGAGIVLTGGYSDKAENDMEVLIPRDIFKGRSLINEALKEFDTGYRNLGSMKLARSGHGCTEYYYPEDSTLKLFNYASFSNFNVKNAVYFTSYIAQKQVFTKPIRKGSNYYIPFFKVGKTVKNKLKMIVSGGSQTNVGESLKSTEIFHWSNNSWTISGDMVKSRFGHQMLNVGKRIIAMGGQERNPDIVLDSIEEFDPDSGTWSLLPTRLAKPRTSFAAALIPHSVIPDCIVNES